jgi:hypothetical protein
LVQDASLEPPESRPRETKTLTVEAADAPSRDPIVSPPEPPAIVIDTDPVDAEIYENGIRVCSLSPCKLTYPPEADPGTRHKLYISRGDLCDAQIKMAKLGERLRVTLKCIPPAEFDDRRQTPY